MVSVPVLPFQRLGRMKPEDCMTNPTPSDGEPSDATTSPESSGGDHLFAHGSLPPRKVRDTVIMHRRDFFDNLGVQNIPLPEFHELSQLIAANFGIKVGENKITLVTGRVHPMMEKYGFANHREFLEAIKSDTTGRLISELANRISTNHTAFYREDAHFSLLREKVLPEMASVKAGAGNRDFRIWCAACATGEEAYTILFTLLKFLGFDYGNWRGGLLATDISAEALKTARRGAYTRQRLEPVPADVRNLYFDQVDADTFEVKPEVRKEITFRRLNLINDTYPFKRPFDIIFCRNVMIYFSRAIRTRLMTRLHDWLEPGGVLFIGHSESMVGTHSGFEYLAPAVYRRID